MMDLFGAVSCMPQEISGQFHDMKGQELMGLHMPGHDQPLQDYAMCLAKCWVQIAWASMTIKIKTKA